MNANDKTEKVLREIHIMLSKAEPYKPEPSRVIIYRKILQNVNTFFAVRVLFCSIYVLFPRVLHEYGRITTSAGTSGKEKCP